MDVLYMLFPFFTNMVERKFKFPFKLRMSSWTWIPFDCILKKTPQNNGRFLYPFMYSQFSKS